MKEIPRDYTWVKAVLRLRGFFGLHCFCDIVFSDAFLLSTKEDELPSASVRRKITSMKEILPSYEKWQIEWKNGKLELRHQVRYMQDYVSKKRERKTAPNNSKQLLLTTIEVCITSLPKCAPPTFSFASIYIFIEFGFHCRLVCDMYTQWTHSILSCTLEYS